MLLINHSLELHVEEPPEECRIIPANEKFDSCMAILHYRITVDIHEPYTLRFKTIHGFKNRMFGNLLPVKNAI